MPFLTSLLEFNLINRDVCDVDRCLSDEMNKLGFEKIHQHNDANENRSSISLYTGQCGACATVRYSTPGPLLIDITSSDALNEDKSAIIEFSKCLELKLGAKERHQNSIPSVQRGTDFRQYYPTTDGLLIQYDFSHVVFEMTSQYQHVLIMHSHQFGNMLILDGDPNLAESDLVYTHTILGPRHEEYQDQQVLVLGGGDGGLLHELRKLHPAHITMIEIDKVVIDAARAHLRGICHDALDDLKGDDYEVIIDDCVKWLKKYVSEGRKFDYVINDLTAVPITTTPQGESWEFLRLILDLSIQVLTQNGRYFAQGNGFNMTSSLAMYEDQLRLLDTQVDFRRHNASVPSYHETWIFYEIWRRTSTSSSAKS